MTYRSIAAKSLFAALIAAAASATMAQEITIVRDDFQPMTTREAVRAEVLQARATGSLKIDNEASSMSFGAVTGPSAVTREAVRSEAVQWAQMKRPVLSYNSDPRA